MSSSRPACANQPRPRQAASHVSLSRTGVRAPATTGASCLSRVPLPPRMRASATTRASCLSRVPLPPPCARTSHDRGEQPVTCPSPAPACAHQARPRRVASHVSLSRPGLRAPATTGASCLSRVPLPPRMREPATTGASYLSRVPLSPRRARISDDQGELPVTCPSPAPVCAHQPGQGRAACHVSLSHPGVRAPATTEASCLSRVPLPPRLAQTSRDRGSAASHAQCCAARHAQCAVA